MRTSEDHVASSRAYFENEDNRSRDIPMLIVMSNPCPICGMETEMADLDDGRLGWVCDVCGIGWHPSGCCGTAQEDWDGWDA